MRVRDASKEQRSVALGEDRVVGAAAGDAEALGDGVGRLAGGAALADLLTGGLGEDVVAWIKQNVHPLDIVFRLAEEHGIVLLNGSGFDAPDWSARVSFANLDDHVYDDIGRAVRAVAATYVQACESAKASAKAPSAKKKKSPARKPARRR